MSSIFGNNLKVSVFGQSHSKAIGCVIDGLPAGIRISLSRLYSFMARRAPGNSAYSTPRKESDIPQILSGALPCPDDEDIILTCGAPLCVIIANSDTRSSDYSAFLDSPRPGHADYTASIAYGSFQDHRGGGHFSGRLTAPLCVAGGICLQYLEQKGIRIGAHISSLGDIEDERFDPVNVSSDDLDRLHESSFPVIDTKKGEQMQHLIGLCKAEGDSIGGSVECVAIGLPSGIGSPMCDGIENRLAKNLFAIPAVKGVEFGAGFDLCRQRGSTANDPYCVKDGKVLTLTNNCGGILGGISNGMPVYFRCAVKPTPTIMKEQGSVSLSQMKDKTVSGAGRHDPCILPRAVPVVEAVCAITIADMLFDPPKHI